MTRCVGIRGATTANEDTLEAVLEATQALLERLQELNAFTPDDLASILFTTTPDVRSTFPARAARRLGWTQVPMLCAREISAPSTVQRCIRVMIHWNTDKTLAEVRHAYLRGSRVLRPDWAYPKLGGGDAAEVAPEMPEVDAPGGGATAAPAAEPEPAPAAPSPTAEPLTLTPIAFQGEPGAYSQEAIFKTFGAETPCVPCHSFRLAFDAVHTGRARAALMPVENSTAGSVHGVYDLLLSQDLVIVGEVVLPVRHALLVVPGTKLADITEVRSHPQALDQCAGWISAHGWRGVTVHDTAGGARAVAEAGDRSVAAIASQVAGELYGLEVLAEDIQDVKQNFTRFLLLVPRHTARPDAPVPGIPHDPGGRPLKTSLIFATRHVAGDLYGCLAEFAVRDINLAKIESRPDKRTPWNYLFYLDLEGHADDARIAEALQALDRHVSFLRVLGSYPTRALS